MYVLSRSAFGRIRTWKRRPSVGLLLVAVLFRCGVGDALEPREMVEGRLISRNTFATGDWPGADTGAFVVRSWRDQTEDPARFCESSIQDGGGEWRCGLWALTGLFSVIDDRIPDPGTVPLRVLVRVSDRGEEVEAYVSPIGHLIAEFALFRLERDGLALTEGVDEARDRFRPFLFEASYPHASPTAPGLSTDAERQALLLEGMTRIALRYDVLPTFHKTRAVTAALGTMLRKHGEFRDTVIENVSGDVTVRREFLRHDLAREILEMADDIGLPADEAQVLANRINGQSGLLFGFTRAPNLP